MEPDSLPAVEAALDRALSDCLRAPVLPHDFGIRLRRAVDRHDAGELQRHRTTLELEFRHGLARLHSGFVRRCRAAAGFLVLAAVGVGTAVAALLPHLHELSTAAVTPAGQAVNAAIGVGIAAAVWLASTADRRRLL